MDLENNYYRDAQFEYLKGAFDTGKLHHCYIFLGESDCGQSHTINRFASYMFCVDESSPCGKCAICRRVADLSFSDMRVTDALVTLDKVPKIDEIRDMIGWSYNSPMEGKHKLVVIHNIDKLNVRAANLLLKTIEEPPVDTYFILSARDRHGVLPTILSRGMVVAFEPLRDSDDDLMRLSNGRWEMARRLADDTEALSALKKGAQEIEDMIKHISSNNLSAIFAMVSSMLQDRDFDIELWLSLYESKILSDNELNSEVKSRIIDAILQAREQKKSYCRDIAIMDNLLAGSCFAMSG